MSLPNMWGDIADFKDIKAPHEILAEQGKVLAEMTKGMLEMKIERKQSNTIFSYDIFITLPAMQYRQRFLRLNHDIKLYPANLYEEQDTNEYKSSNQQEFEQNLAKVLRSEATRTIISGLLAQARLSGNDIFV